MASDEIEGLRALVVAREKDVADLRKVLDWKTEQLQKLEAAAPEPAVATTASPADTDRPFEKRLQRILVAILVALVMLTAAVGYTFYQVSVETDEIGRAEIHRSEHEASLLRARLRECLTR